MSPPAGLTESARSFWSRHWPRLAAAGLVDDADADTFAILCRTWAELLEVDTTEKLGVIKFVALTKQYERLAKQFHLLAAERQRRNVSLTKPTANEFGL